MFLEDNVTFYLTEKSLKNCIDTDCQQQYAAV